MTRLFIAAAALATFGLAAPAHAFHPSDDTYGYVMPNKWKKTPKVSETESGSLFGEQLKAAKAKKQAALANEAAAADVFADNKKLKKGPAEMSGGGKPSISPVAPKTVSFPNSYGAGKIVIDTAGRRLYYVLSSSSAYQYPIAVGKAGFAWSGTQSISRKVAWPDWRPPAEMLQRKPHLPQHMTGGVRNPLGAMALYLGNSLYRIHGTNDVASIGTAASSGCIRMTNGNVMHLSKIAGIGTTVHVLPKLPKNIAKAANGGASS
ncbi:MAG TPA: L,D-transpeptidase [Hyphomicrobium sp.]|nr:L,D-transpeptidase [Hyphomicrobium sp.]